MALLSATMALGILACTSEETPTQPEAAGNQSIATSSLALASNTWTAKAPRPGTALFGATAGVFPNSAGRSIVYVFGGTDGEGGSGFVTAAYDVATNTWTGKGQDSRVYVFDSNGVGKIGSKLYFSGGYDYGAHSRMTSSQLWAYDPAANRLILKRDMPKFTAEGVTGVIDAKLYVLPGTCSGDAWPTAGYCAEEPIRQLFRYDPITNTWITRRSSPHFHRSGAAGVIDGRLYVAGGLGVADLDVYDPATNSWKALASMPTAGRAIGATLGGKLFVIVGEGSELHTYVYSPATNTWKTRASPTWGHDAVVRVTLNGTSRLLAVGGSHGGPDLDIPNDSELYTP
jgi:N-acetylneuraminic acid mutarotase